MTNNEILQADLLDILFEHRNKAYGAYALRKTYNHRLQWALGISLSLAAVLSFMNFSGNERLDRTVYNDREVSLSPASSPTEKHEQPQQRKQRSQPQTAQV